MWNFFWWVFGCLLVSAVVVDVLDSLRGIKNNLGRIADSLEEVDKRNQK